MTNARTGLKAERAVHRRQRLAVWLVGAYRLVSVTEHNMGVNNIQLNITTLLKQFTLLPTGLHLRLGSYLAVRYFWVANFDEI